MAKKELLVGFYRREKPDGSCVYCENRSSIKEFDQKEKDMVLQSGIPIDKIDSKVYGGTTYNYYYKLVKNKIWSNPNGFEIIGYGYAASTAYFTVKLESDLEANIKLKEFFTLMKNGKIKDNRIVNNLTFGSFGNARYLMEAI